MLVTFRLVVIALAGAGLAVGIAFGVGVAYGKGDTKTVNSGLTQQQIQALVGGSTTGGGGGAPTTGTRAAGTPSAGTTPGTTSALGNNATGQITAIDSQSVTLQTATGSVKVALSNSTVVQTLTTGKASDLKVGDTILATGSRNTDGSIAATALSALPAQISSLLSGGGGGLQRPGAQPTP